MAIYSFNIMDSATEEIFLQKIEELVMDEDKIVTNSIVCDKFDTSITESKHILEKYVSDGILYPGKISVTYLVCGKLHTGEYSIKILDSLAALKEIKKKFSLVSNEVIYSVQKGNTIDFNVIALSEKCEVTSNVYKGIIIGEKCVKRNIKSVELPPLPPQKNFDKQKPPMFFKSAVKKENDCDMKAIQTPSTNGANIKKKNGGLQGFLSQTPNNSKNEIKPQTRKTPSSEEDTREIKRPRMETNDCQEVKVEVKMEKGSETNDVINEKSTKNEEFEEKTPRQVQIKKTTSAKGSNKKKQEGKKRKRIIVQSDSEDDMFGNDEEEEKPDEDIEEEKPVAILPKESIPKNKRRKAVEKVYTDEEGFVVTKTEYVLVSESEDEESDVKDEKPKEAEKSVQKGEKKSPPQKAAVKGKKGKPLATNQPTLMNFFKKK